MRGDVQGLGADPEFRERLRILTSPPEAPSEAPSEAAPETPPGEPPVSPTWAAGESEGDISPERAEALLARLVWARLVEPGDAVAGTLIAALGAAPLLSLLVAGRSGRAICDRARAAGANDLDERAVAAGVRRWVPRLDRAACLADLDRGIAGQMRILTPETPAWPVALNDLGAHAPLALWVRGHPARLAAPKLAIVGARACTGYGAHITAELASAAGAAGVTVVSGAAYGIDAAAHRAALAAAHPTIAVLAGGADRSYPSAHRTLLERIAATGAVCSELVPGAAPTRWRFLQRNRLIAALARATLVTEAGLRSGSLNTAGHAAALGRPLGAVPGPITSAASSGCHLLLREYGADLVTNEEELRELLELPRAGLPGEGPAGGDAPPAGSARQPPLHRRIIDALPLRGRRSTAEVARRAGVELAEARGALAELALLGHVAQGETPGPEGDEWALQRRE
ncbi:DNA-processing protein DprA [Leucobacter luti]|uniref:DNA protecting protein DprA n=1 Tax=Leucobacter luti TaxID=340320 RepID=A0A4Q7TY73_9MICO|nr:DNA-processing protein DprA [Leucobacter luti]MBL3698255.1 DNA-protecting protein DprA [Leucobacter luti]RZT64662.1 DNA protecting protein DprA [Leucobacter luti]